MPSFFLEFSIENAERFSSQSPLNNDAYLLKNGRHLFCNRGNVLVYGRYGQKADMAGHDNWHVVGYNVHHFFFVERLLATPGTLVTCMRTSRRSATATLAVER